MAELDPRPPRTQSVVARAGSDARPGRVDLDPGRIFE